MNRGWTNGLFDRRTKAKFESVPIEMKKGYAAFHHPLMVHGFHENKSNRSRRAFVLNVFADGTITLAVPIVRSIGFFSLTDLAISNSTP